MLKGKFYTGLPEKMMNRSRGMNRQQTNFYWPNESEAEDSKTTREKRRSERVCVDRQPANNDDVDIKARDRFQKSLTSGIEFFDNVDAKTPEARRRRLKKIDNVNLNNSHSQFQPEKKKLETFTSKIEFYDFVDDLKPKSNNSVKKTTGPAAKSNVEGESVKKQVDNSKKRITFHANSVEKTKSILKNNDIKKSTNSTPTRRGLMLSKSVENISKLAKNSEDLSKNENDCEEKLQLGKIIRDVNNLNLSNGKPQRQAHNKIYDDDDGDEFYSNTTAMSSVRKTRIENGRYGDYRHDDYDRGYVDRRDRDFEEDRISRSNIINKPGSKTYDEEDRNIKIRGEIDFARKTFVDEHSNRSRYDDDRKHPRSSGHEYGNHYESKRNNYDGDDDYKRRPLARNTTHGNRRRIDVQEDDSQDIDPRPVYRESVDRRNYEDDYQEHNSCFENDSKIIPNRSLSRRNDDDYGHYDDHNSKSSKRSENEISRDRGWNNRSDGRPDRDNTTPSRSRYQQNLKSSIFFDDSGPAQPNRPVTVRNSAVCRIGVGLPDL